MTFRRMAGGHVRGSVLKEIFMGSPIAIDLPESEFRTLLCDIAKVPHASAIETMMISYKDVYDYVDSTLIQVNSGFDLDCKLFDGIKTKFVDSKIVQGSKIELLALTQQMRFRLKTMTDKCTDVHWGPSNEDLSVPELVTLFTYIDVQLTTQEVEFLIGKLYSQTNKEEQDSRKKEIAANGREYSQCFNSNNSSDFLDILRNRSAQYKVSHGGYSVTKRVDLGSAILFIANYILN